MESIETAATERPQLALPEVERSSPGEMADNPQIDDAPVAPRTEHEHVLCEIWSEILQVPKVGIRDNFFLSGGDSILAIQVASRAKARGLHLSARHLFQYQTVEALAAQAQAMAREVPQQDCVGGITLLPIQLRFFEVDEASRHHFLQSRILRGPPGLTLEFLREAVRALYRRHDVLRLRYLKNGSHWQAQFADAQELQIDASVESAAWLPDAGSDPRDVLAEYGNAARAAINIESGPLLKAVLFTGEPGSGAEPSDSCLLLVLHHLAMDGISWRIILDDLTVAFEQWQSGQPIRLAPKTNSYQDWGNALLSYSRSEVLAREHGYWLASFSCPVGRLPVDFPEAGDHRQCRTQDRLISWSKHETTALLTRCHTAYGTQINDLLLAALLLAVYRWTGQRAIRIALEGHGRETAILASEGEGRTELDLSQTVGWFTSYYPLTLSLPDMGDEPQDREHLIGEVCKAVKEQCRAVPNRGLGYGLLRYLCEESALVEAERTAPLEIVFNYLGQFDRAADGQRAFSADIDRAGSDIHPQRPREHLLGLNGAVNDGCLALNLDYNSLQFRAETIEVIATAYAEAVREVIAHCQKSDVGGFTPSDFPLARLRQHDVDHWHALYPKLEDLYPATGMQLGLLFLSRLQGSEDAYTNQIHLTLTGTFDTEIFAKAWLSTLSRHAILRTAFVGMDGEEPLQLVVSEVRPGWEELDHRDLDAAEQDHAFESYRRRDKKQPFNFSRPPLMRFALFRESEIRHRFLWTYHHSLLDGWSVALIWNEVLASYHDISAGTAPQLPTPIPYSNYVRWLQKQGREPATAYWSKELAGVERATAVWIEQRGVDSADEGPARVHWRLSETESLQLQRVAKSQQVTLATVAQAAWACLLHLYSGDRRVVFGVTVSGRAIDLPRVEVITGLFINTVPVRVDMDGARSVGEWLRIIHAAQVERERHSHLSLIDIQRCSGVRAGDPLFDSVLIVENYPNTGKHPPTQLNLSDKRFAEDTHYGLTVLVIPGDRLTFDLAFDPMRFSRADINALAERLKDILRRITGAQPDELVRSLYAPVPGVPVAEVGTELRLSKACRQGELRLGRYLVHQLIENQAQTNPWKIALRCGDADYSYDALNRAANRIANHLLDRFPNLKADSLIGLMLPRGDELLLAILAIWKVGAAYIPIDPDLPAARILTMLQSSNAMLVIGNQESLDGNACSECGIPAIILEGIATDDRQCDANPDIHVSGNDLCYVIYTSGSSGIPKGAMVEHIGMLNNIANKIADLGIDENSCIAQTASQSFDISVWQMFAALTCGATTVIYDDRIINDIGRFMQRLAVDTITILEMVPSYLILVVEFLDEQAGQLPQSTVRHLILTGETADADFIRKWFHHFPGTKVMNAYGPTEASDDITHHILSSYADITNPIPIGRVLANFDIYIVDEGLNPVPIGEKGEIVVTGVGVGRGYINSAGATALAFVGSPFPDKYRGRLYRTGDVGQMREDGSLIFHGRKDGQVKVRGFRIELEEVEIRLRELEMVRQAAVLDIAPPGSEAFLCAFVVPRETVSRDVLIDGLKTKLPAYMIPGEFHFLERLPQLDNGKTDRSALRNQYRDIVPAARAAGQTYHPPATEIEIRLAHIWSEVLKTERVGVTDDFFDLGGDSFKAIRIATKYGPGLEVTDIYQLRSIRAVAAKVEQADGEVRRIVLVAGRKESAQVAILGIANSGGDPVSFFEMGRELASLGQEMVIYAVKLPRNEVENDDAMTSEMERLSEEICEVIAKEIPLPLILFGQCNGSALALSIAQRLQKKSAPPRAVCIGGALLRMARTPKDRRTDREIVSFLGTIGASLPEEPDELAFFLHDFRYDGNLASCYYNNLLSSINRGAIDTIDAPIYCMVGSEDRLVEGYRAKVKDWEYLSREVSLIEFPDRGHFLLRDCPHELAIAVRELGLGVGARACAC